MYLFNHLDMMIRSEKFIYSGNQDYFDTRISTSEIPQSET